MAYPLGKAVENWAANDDAQARHPHVSGSRAHSSVKRFLRRLHRAFPFAFSPSSSNCATAFDLVRFRFVAHASMAAITFSGTRPATTLSRLVAGLAGLRFTGGFDVTAFLGGLGKALPATCGCEQRLVQ